MKVAIACDHGAFELKRVLIDYLSGKGHNVSDLGCFSDESVDYPTYAFPLSEAVARGDYERGILLCGTGIGMSICANKVRGIRCALCSEPVSAALTRRHNDANVLAMGARIIGTEAAKAIADTFLETAFDGGRHLNRVALITEYEGKK